MTDGTGKSAAVAGYRVAGKTGTAQIPVVGGYARHDYLPSFVGFAPADRPSLVGIVAVDAPQGIEYYGAQVAAPVFGTLVREVLLYLGVRPQRQAPSRPVVTAGPGKQARDRRSRRSPRPAMAPADGGVATAADDDAVGEDVPELWRGQRIAPGAPLGSASGLGAIARRARR